MPERINIEELILRHSVHMAERMNEIAQWANTEEDVRHEVNKLIDAFCAEASIKARGRHEYGLAGGFIDSKYGGVIIEYKCPKGPGRITLQCDAPGNVAVVQQIRQRFRDFRKDEHIEPERLFAVGCDGDTLVYVRYRNGRFDIEAPQPVTNHTVERLLRALISLGARGSSFTPARLAEIFGADGKIARSGIRDIYDVVSKTDNLKALTFFRQWKVLFGEVCGYDVEGKNEKVKKLGSHYGLYDVRPAELLFSVHTYYAIFMKLLAAEIASTFVPFGISAIKRCVEAPTSEKLRSQANYLEAGGIWKDLGITNFLEGDLFSWYLAAWNDKMAAVVKALVLALDGFDVTTLSVDPTESRDLLKKMYQQLFPKSIRHDLGEYYTPDWLADYTLQQLGYDGNPDARILDPSCGSGTFLVMAINRVRAWFRDHRHECGYDEAGLVRKIMRNVIGFDLNPLAVMAARTNYLMAIRDLLRFAGGAELPVYLCDSVVTPAIQQGMFTEGGTAVAGAAGRELKTTVGSFTVPTEVTSSGAAIGKYAETLEHCVTSRYSAAEFIKLCRSEGLTITEDDMHSELFGRLVELHEKDQNGVWARIIKNAFAPLFLERVDYIAGNPPWVNWESLPGQYRTDMMPLWERYGLFSLTKAQGRLGGGKKDLAMLFVYACADNYLSDGGALGFVITQTVFKTKGAGDGFRRFWYDTPDGPRCYLMPVSVTDMSDLQPFEAATNRTAVFVCKRSRAPFGYPVTYKLWTKARPTSLYSQIDSKTGRSGERRLMVFSAAEDLSEVQRAVHVAEMAATPVAPSNPTAPWLTLPSAALSGVAKVLGPSAYTAHAGVYSGGLNGCYWVTVLGDTLDGSLLIRNLHDVGDKKVEPVECAVEPGLIYPLVRGRDVHRWLARPSAHIVLTQDPESRIGIKEAVMKASFPKTYSYLNRFKEQLLKRASSSIRNLMKKGAFYSMFAVGPYTLAPYKVMWRDMGSRIQVAVAEPVEGRPVCPEHHVMAVSLSVLEEAHYLCAALMSSPVQLTVAGYTTTTGMSTHILEHVRIPPYSASNPLHVRLAALSKRCHDAAARGDKEKLAGLEDDLDQAACELWGSSEDEMSAIRDALAGIAAPDPDTAP